MELAISAVFVGILLALAFPAREHDGDSSNNPDDDLARRWSAIQ